MQRQKDWFRDRGYPHFSSKTPARVRKSIQNYITNAKKVSQHPFRPLIYKEIRQRRYKVSNFGKTKRRSHKKLKSGQVFSNTKIREILYATHIDAHIFSYYAQRIISPKYESFLKRNTEIDNAITAYRQIKTHDNLKFKNNVHFAKEVFEEIKQRKNCAVLAFDIENFFPSLNHKKLKFIWAKILGCKTLPADHYNIFKAVTRFSYVRLQDLKISKNYFDEKELSKNRKKGSHTFYENIKELINSDIVIYKNQKKNKKDGRVGIPQGLPISALLANIYMLPFDNEVVKKLSQGKNIYYRRYSDDIIIICDEVDVEYVKNFVIDEIKKIELTISKEKTEQTFFKIHNNRLQCFGVKDNKLKINVPLSYLGFEFYGYQTLLKSKNLAKFYREMKMAIRRKSKRVEKINEKYLIDISPIYKRKIYRLYSFKGVKTRKLPAKKTEFHCGNIKTKAFLRQYRGNYIRYAYRAATEMNAPEIKRQVRNHWDILQATMKRYTFSNVQSEKKD